MKILIKFGFLALTLIGFDAFAEGNCPQGYYPVYNNNGGGGQVGCAPMSGGGGGGYQGGGGKKRPKPYWVDSYGAIAIGKNEKGENAIVYDKKISSQELADKEIFFLCDTLKYTDCKIGLRFKNFYAVIVKDENGMFYFSANKNRDNAADEAMAMCKKSNSQQCNFVGALDSTAKLVQP